MCAAVIASVKARYHSARMTRAVDLTDENLANVYKVDVLTSMRMLKTFGITCPPRSSEIAGHSQDYFQTARSHWPVIKVLPTRRLMLQTSKL